MKKEQLAAGLIAHSLLYSIDSKNPFGQKARSKLARAFKIKFRYYKERREDYFNDCVDLADGIFRKSWGDISDNITIALPKVVHFLVLQNPELFEPFKINKRHLEALNRASNTEGLAMNSTKVARSIAKYIKLLEE